MWRVETWDAGRACWVLDGAEEYSTGITRRCEGTAQQAAERLLRNWAGEFFNTAASHWRATVWNWQGKPLGEPAAMAETARLGRHGLESEAEQ
jgi:hypothetical protein